ncbi:MAG TPA: translation initiation factor IF-3 [Verrucomicrobiales bacterium]|jgi:translation initiation factor IF-3|nr:translation initiation factor IF-3 [Verrucomicrobiales bacterium]
MTRVNERIRAPKVRVIDGETNSQLGVLTPAEAMQIARSRGLDLVEVAAEAKPPVCKIISYGKWKYEQSKHNKDKGKQKGGKVKEIKFRININEHDYLTKLQHGEEFLDHNNKLRIILQFRGREVAHPEIGMQRMNKIIEDLKTMSHVDMSPRQSGRSISMTLSPLAQHLRHRKFEKPKVEYVEDVEDDEDEEDDPDSHKPHLHTLPLEDILSEMEEDDGRPKKRH